MANADISLLFGVLGEGSLSGESGSLIQGQLTQIMAALNKNPLKVKIALDTEKGGQKSWSSQLQTKLNEVSSSGKFSVQVSKLTLGTSAITDFRNQLNAVINTLHLDKGTSITLTADGVGEIKSKMKQAGDAAFDAARKTAEFKVQIEALNRQKTSVQRALSSLSASATTDEERTKVAELTAQYEQWAIKIEQIRATKTAANGTYRAEIEAEGAAISANITRLHEERAAAEAAAASATAAATERATAEEAAASATEHSATAGKDAAAAQKDLDAARKQGLTLLTQMQKAERDWSAAKVGKSGVEYANIQESIRNLQTYLAQLRSGEIDVAEFRQRLAELGASFADSSNVIKSAGENTKTLSERLGGLAQKFGTWLSVSRVIMAAVRTIRQMVTSVIELDSAMAQLKIVTGSTDIEMERFLSRSISLAKELGRSVTEVLGSIETFSRLGYNLADASSLAEFANVLANVAAVDTDAATTGLTSIVKGFNMDVSEAEHVADVLVEVGQKYAVSAGELMEAYERSGAALNAANTSFEKSAGLIAAANASVQDASTVGTALKTISARIRGAKSDLEALGEDTSDLAEGFSKYAKEIKALTGFDIMVDGSTNTYKDIYDIFEGISKVWDDLSDTQQARVSEILGGTRQLQVISSILGNWKDAAGAYADAMDSAGTATEANAIYMDSVQGKVGKLKATFQELSNTLIGSDFLKQFIELGTVLLEIVNGIAQVIDKLGGLNTILTATVGIIATIKAQSILTFFGSTLPTALGKAMTGFFGLFDIIGRIPSVIKSFNSGTALAVPGTSRLSAALKGLGISASAAQVAFGALTLAITAGVIIYQRHQRALEENRQKMNEAADAADEERKSLTELIAEYERLASAGDFDEKSRETVKGLQQQITDLVGEQADNLDLVNGKLDDEIKKLDEISYKSAEERRNALETKYLSAKSDVGETFNMWSEGLPVSTGDAFVMINKAWAEAGLGTVQEFFGQNKNHGLPGLMDGVLDGLDVEEQLEQLKKLQDLLLDTKDIWYEEGHGIRGAGLLTDLEAEIEKRQELVDELNSAQTAFFENEAIIDQFEYMKANSIDSQEAFNTYINGIKNSNEYSKEYQAVLIELASKTFPEFAEAAGLLEGSAEATGESITTYVANLSKLTDVLTGLKSSYDALEAAELEMGTGEGLSAETIESLAKAEENYLDYLYEENGVIKLNTEAWKENANAKMLGEMDEIQKEINSLQERNAALQESVEYYTQQRNIGYDGGIWTDLITQSTREIEENNAAIAENQGKLAIYSSLYGSITGDLDAYTAALHNFSNIANTIDTVSNSFQTLADLQAEVANGFTMSLEKALEFASVYPEILNNAQVSADGQIVLNEGVVNTFIQGKKAELDAQIDAEIAKLEADKAVLEAKMQAAQAQLDLAKNVGEGEGQISKELAEYRINAGNAVAQAMIDAGIDEATAFRLAALAMAQNAEEFDRVAMEVCTDVNGNFNQAAYDLAQTMYNNLTNVKTDLASVAKQAHETAKAIAGIENGTVAGSTGIQGGSGGGTGSSGIKLNLTQGSFQGTEYTYEAKESNLEDFISDIELDISNYEDAIAQINGQIATLQALKNLPLKSFKSDTGTGSKGSGSQSSEKEIEEYIADIDAYYAALKKLESIQLHRADIEARIENSDSNDEKIALTKELIDVYHQEADALENLNNLRSETIQSGVKELEALGFQIEYNAETNEFFIKNLEHLNELQADSAGEYETLQEATNALRENTDGLIDSLEELNSANQDSSDSIRNLGKSVKDAKDSIVEYLQEIVDEANEIVDGFQDVYTTLTDAAKEYAQNGFLSVDSLQAILELGPKYLEFLYNENGQLVLNEQNLQRVIAAKTEEMAAETALSYAKQVLLAAEQAETDTLVALTQANATASTSTWNMAYATLGLAKAIGVANGMDAGYFDDAVAHIQKMQSLSKTAVNSISAYYKTLDEGYISQKDGLNQILELTKDMIRHENEDMIDALERQKDAFADIVQLRKEALEAAKKEGEYDDEIEEKIRKIAKLQDRINTLSLDDSRDAQAEKIRLEEEMYELQKELADLQADHALDAQTSALDKVQTAFEDQKDDEIAALEDTLSSEEKLYQAAIARINQGWDELYQDLLDWNYEYGSTLQSELVSAWDAASEAVQRYGSFVDALEGVQSYTNLGNYDSSSAESGSQTYGNANSIINQMRQNSIAYWAATDSERAQINANQLALAEQYRQVTGDNIERVDGSWFHDDGSRLYSLNKSEVVNEIVARMKQNGAAYGNASTSKKKELSDENLILGSRLGSYLGKNVYRDSNGVWWIEGRHLFDVYHRGGIAGGNATLKQDEVMAILKKGEPVLDEKREQALYRIIDFTTALSERLGKAISSTPMAGSLVTAKSGLPDLHDAALESITNNQNETVHFGDVYIYGGNEETVERHREVNRQFTNEVLRQLNIKK